MSCKEILFEAARDPERCKCQSAVLKAYVSMMSAGRPHQVALEAAGIVYRFHHPEDSKMDAALTVERWIYAENFH